jgi:hypothetical protein
MVCALMSKAVSEGGQEVSAEYFFKLHWRLGRRGSVDPVAALLAYNLSVLASKMALSNPSLVLK